jgi:hypothetical protein
MIEINPYHQLIAAIEYGGWEALEHRYSLARDYARELAQGQGGGLENPVLRLWHSEQGLFYEFKDAPMAFYGRLGAVAGEYLSEGEANLLLWDALTLAQHGQAEVMAIYGPGYLSDENQIYMAYWLQGQRVERGYARQSLPLFLRTDNHGQTQFMVWLQGEYLKFDVPRGAPLLPTVKD